MDIAASPVNSFFFNCVDHKANLRRAEVDPNFSVNIGTTSIDQELSRTARQGEISASYFVKLDVNFFIKKTPLFNMYFLSQSDLCPL